MSTVRLYSSRFAFTSKNANQEACFVERMLRLREFEINR